MKEINYSVNQGNPICSSKNERETAQIVNRVTSQTKK